MDDLELLRRYAQERSEPAFAMLVGRYVNLVYSAALRQVRHGPLAEEVAQTVFLLLARKAGALGGGAILPGWLLRTTRFAAANALRREARRKRYEREFMANTLQAAEPDLAWERIAPLLDEALVGLGEKDRDAVVLRFFDKKNFREIGLALGLSEDNAQKRVSRALERLRAFFRHRGSEVTVAALASALAANGVQAAPETLPAAAVSAALQGGLAGGALLGLAQSTLQSLAWVRARMVAFYAGTGVLILGIALWITSQFNGAFASRAGQARLEPLPPAAAPSGRPAAPVTAPQGQQLVFHAVDAENGAPVMNARLTLAAKIRWSDLLTHIVATDASGTALLPRPLEGDYWYYRIEVFQDGYVPKFVSWSQDQGDTVAAVPLEYTTKLERGTQIGGKVVNEQGEPIMEVKIVFSVSGPSSRARECLTMRGDYHTEITGARGRWSCDHVPRRFGMITWHLEHPLYQTLICGPDSPESMLVPGSPRLPVSDFLAGNALMVMKAGLIVAGVVLDKTGNPIAGAKVTQGNGMSSPEAKLVTGADGRFRFANARSGSMALTFQAEGCAPTNQVIEVQPQLELLRVVLGKGQVLRGLVVDESGQPIAHASIRVTPYSPNVPNLEWSTNTDEQGRFEWLSAPVSPQQYYLSVRNYDTQPKLVLRADGSEHLITLSPVTKSRPPTRVVGSAIDAETRQPVGDFQVLVSRRTKSGTNSLSIYGFEPKASGHNGQFSFQIDGATVQVATEIQAGGYLPARTTNQINGEAELVVDLELHTAAPLKGQVKLPDGRPVADALVLLSTDRDFATMRRPGIFQIESASTVSIDTDAQGRFTLPARPGMVGVVVAHKLGFAEMTPEALRAVGVMVLQAWRRVEGTVKLGEQSVAGQTLWLTSSPSGQSNLTRRIYSVVLETKTDAAGLFVFEGVPPGTYWLSTAPTKAPLPPESLRPPFDRETIGTIGKTIVVPKLTGEDDHAPLDLGALELQVAP